MANIFGFEITKKKKDLKSFSAPESNDGSVEIAAGGGALGHYVDMEGKIKNEIELINRYRGLAVESEVDAAVDDVVNEAIVISSEREDAIFLDLTALDASDTIKDKMHDEFAHIIKLLNFNKNGYDTFRNWYIDGRLYHHMVIDDEKPKQGIQEIRQIDPRKIRKVKEVKRERAENGVELVSRVEEFYMYNDKPNDPANQMTKGIKIKGDAISYIHSGLQDNKKGMILSYLHKAIKPMNQLRMMEDSTVIYRISRAPERRLFYIDVGNLPKGKAEEYLQDQMRRFQNKLVYDVDTGEIKDDRKHMSMLEDFWLPRREGGRGTEISTLPGGQNLGEMEDVGFFQKKLLKSLNVPPSRYEGDSGFSLGRESEITRDELKFSKFIGRLRNQFSKMFDTMLKTQLILKGIIREEEWSILHHEMQYKWAEDSYYRETKNSEMLMARMGVLREVAEYSGRYLSMAWIKKNVLQFTDEEVREMDKEIKKEVKGDKLAKDTTKEFGIHGPPMEGMEGEPGAEGPPEAAFGAPQPSEPPAGQPPPPAEQESVEQLTNEIDMEKVLKIMGDR